MTQVTTQNEETVGENVHVVVHRKPACRIELDVKTKGSLIEQASKQAIKAVSREVVIPGFRKGKAPEETILKKFPADVARQMQKTLADLAFVEAQKTVRIPLLNNNAQISFDLKKQSPEGAELVFSFETEPTIPSVDPKLFQPKPVVRAEVTDKQVDEAVRQMRFFYAEWKAVQDRPVQDSDYILINLDTIEEEAVQNVFHHVRFEVSKARMAEWMQKLVSGAKAGDVLEGMSEPDDTATEEEKKEFKPKKVRLTLLKVEEATLPELDDEFAKKVGAPDAFAMRQSITDLLNKQVDEKVATDLGEQVNDFLVATYAFDLPQSLIDTERKHRQAQLLQDPKFRAQWEKMAQQERRAHEQKLAEEAASAVRLFYLSRKVVQDAKIPVTHNEVEREAVSLLRSHGSQNVDKISKEVFALALSKVLLAKTQAYVVEQSKKQE